jgi:hypothetical protein
MGNKQAVVLIHGIGEQRPMDTLRGFVRAVWSADEDLHNPYAGDAIWSQPDTVSGSFELRRLVTPKNRSGVETDFYEFYWAHLMKGTTVSHVFAWVKTLLWRSPSSVPRDLLLAYGLLLAAAGVSLALLVYSYYAKATSGAALPWELSALLGIAIIPIASYVSTRIVGDAARYLHVAATNVQSRHEIRTAGLTLLKALHAPSRGYGRIVVVGHSLGSVIGYDVLTYAWAEVHREYTTQGSNDALERLEGFTREGARPDEFRSAQAGYFSELVDNGCPWRVTDFITVGSPLAHAQVLLANDAFELARKQAAREFPTCPPVLEELRRAHEPVRRFSFEYPTRGTYRVPHHAAVFSATRWTNLFFTSRFIVAGDLIGGPVGPVMGWGVSDVPVSTPVSRGFFAHTHYWTLPDGGSAPDCVVKLREALALG